MYLLWERIEILMSKERAKIFSQTKILCKSTLQEKKKNLTSKLTFHNTVFSMDNNPSCQPVLHLLEFNYVYIYVVL